MANLRNVAALGALACALAACSQPAARVNPVLAKEQAAVAPLKRTYTGVVTGLDVKGRTLLVYVDVNAMYSLDESSEAQMKSDALARWKSAWAKAHPKRHATVQVSLRDYYGKELYRASARV